MDPLYHFAHRALQRPFRQDPAFLEDLIANPQITQGWLLAAAQESVELAGASLEFQKALFDLSAVHTGNIFGRPAVIVSLPPPQVATHCYFVAAFRNPDGELRYYTLERSMNFGGIIASEPETPDPTMLCRWSADGSHQLIGTGPKPEVAAFTGAIEKAEREEYEFARKAERPAPR